jgi:PTH1 family peptidyl-tRNA hydrolase
MENLYLIVGLGNPGAEYARTRHNAGFLVAQRLARRWQVNWALEANFQARLAWVEREGRRVMLCQPQTYMNLSGEAVRQVKQYYRVALDRLLVLVDDADLSFGQIRLRPQGSSGGHHGLESVEYHLGTREYPRLRVGIGRAKDEARQITNYVLGRFNPTELKRLDKVLDRAADQVECWLSTGIGRAMSEFNGPVDSPGHNEKTTE